MKSIIRNNDESNIYVKNKKQLYLDRYIKYLNNINQIGKTVKSTNKNTIIIPNGSKVRINYKDIVSRPDYNSLVNKYKNFIETNKDKIMTVEYDSKYIDNPILVCLKEDTTNPKWLFHCEYDLIVVDNKGDND